ncbi:glycosyltransferase involved in cell wall biosynthesis [Salinibacter ruber]|uniref:glycosyltransferase family 4 protein n=1 Tax=Salinibacter ruber TaxID=146919 RepID=UPI00216A1A64|nr:glycosyltransferase family 4 protein [Salinibacter ruber]MCS4044595.1 glycosyltransferase involved in cell wall biosynthesis [Salinibacter ruber]
MLGALYTDATESVLNNWMGRTVEKMWDGRLARLRARSLPAIIPGNKVHSYPRYTAQKKLVDLVRSDSLAERNYRYRLGSHGLAQQLIRDDFAGCNALYVHACNGTEAIEEAQRRGLFVVLEAVSMPYHKYIEREEYKRHDRVFPDPDEEIKRNISFFRDEALMADLVVAASTHVENGLHELGVSPSHTAVVPYGIERGFYDRSPSPEPGRILFVGHVNYLKGVPYLAKAARILESREVDCNVRVVGGYDDGLIERPEFAGPSYVGAVPRSQVKDEFLRADVFVFPTLSDGFGIVLAEAAAAGLPIVSTPNCGDVVEDEHNGFVVPTRDPEALANRIQRLVENRRLRSEMSLAAHDRFCEHFTIQKYKENLAAAIRSRYERTR